MKKKEIRIILTPKQAEELEGFAVYLSIKNDNLILRIPFVKTADITTLRIYNILVGVL